MNPGFTTTADWFTIWFVTTSLFRFAGLQIVGALCFLAAHAIIPSLIFTYHLSPRAASVRPVFYVVSIIAFVLAWLSFAQAIGNGIGVLDRLYPRWPI